MSRSVEADNSYLSDAGVRKFLMPSFDVIWVNITSMNVWKYDLNSSFLVLLGFMRNCLCCTEGYYFLSNLVSGLSITAPVAALLNILLMEGGLSLSGLLVSLTMYASYSCTTSLISSVSDSWSSSFTSSIVWYVSLLSYLEISSSI